ncbi:MAG: hypothetical protein WD490_01185 [Opitutales bacterium]
MNAPLHVKNAPSPGLVFTCLIGGILSFIFLAGWSALHYSEWGGFYANTRFLAWVHVAVLGWINLIIFGVLFQFIPVVLNVRLGSEKLAWWQLAFYVPGAAGMVGCFWIGRLDWPLHTFASILWVGFFLFIWNMLLTYRQVKDWTQTAQCIYAGVLYLLVTTMLGLFLSIHLAYPMVDIPHLTLLKLHAHAGFVGWFLMIVMGVSLKLLPMFLLSYGYSTKPAAAAFYLINAGLLSWGLAVAFDLPPAWQLTGIGMLISGIAFYLAQVVLIFRKRSRMRSDPFRRRSVRPIEFPLRFAAAACALLGVATLAGVAVAFSGQLDPGGNHNRFVLIYGALVFLGFLALLVQALLYKIVPFLIWLKRFSNTAGKYRTPKIVDLVPARSAVSQLLVYSLGAVLVVIALGIEGGSLAGVGTVLIFVSSLWFGGNLLVAWTRAVPLGALRPGTNCEPPAPVSIPTETSNENTALH